MIKARSREWGVRGRHGVSPLGGTAYHILAPAPVCDPRTCSVSVSDREGTSTAPGPIKSAT